MAVKILVAEDDPNYLEELSLYLDLQKDKDEEGWEIIKASNEKEGLEQVKSHFASGQPIAVILSDLRFPGDKDGGLKLIEQAQQCDPKILSILYTTVEDFNRIPALQMGVFSVVERRIGRDELTAHELMIHAERALDYRARLDQMDFLGRHFDRRLFLTLEKSPELFKPGVRHVTVVFWDLEGSSRLHEDLVSHPDKVAEFMSVYYNAAAKTVFENHGILEKFTGDGVTAIFGVLPESRKHEGARAALNAARQLRSRFMKALDTDFQTICQANSKKRLVPPGLRCGMHTDNAWIGTIRTDYRDQYTILGSTANFASRVEQLGRGRRFPILTSLTTQKRIGDVPGQTILELGPQKVAGFPDKYEIFEVDPLPAS